MPIMNFNNQDRKGGVVSSCRDRGWGGADEGALSASPSHTVELRRSERLGLQSGQAQGPLISTIPPPVPHIIDGRSRTLVKSKRPAGLVVALGEPPFVLLARACQRR
jgi:hypothetical protein